MSDLDLRALKSEAFSYPEPLRMLILTAKDSMSTEELLGEFMRWRKIARTLDAMQTGDKP